MTRKLLAEDFAENLLSWNHSGFSIDNSVRMLDESSQDSLAEYIARPPMWLKKIHYESFKGRVLFHTTYSEYFKQNLHMSDAVDFLERPVGRNAMGNGTSAGRLEGSPSPARPSGRPGL